MTVQEQLEISEQQRGKGVYFHRIRRITGYLTGDTKRWCTAKQHEEKDRLAHRL